jgi:hypothetical protein
MPWTTPQDWKTALDNIGMTDHLKTMQVPDSLGDTLADGNWEVIFHQFTQSEFASENVDFLRAVATFESSGDHAQAVEIYQEFVSTTAGRQVNLSGGVRGPLDALFGEEGDHEAAGNDAFDGAKAEIEKMLSNDTFRRFKDGATRAQTALGATEDWDAVQTRGRSRGGDAPLPAGRPGGAAGAAAPPPPPPAGDDVPPPPPADADGDDVPPPPPPPGASPAPGAVPPPPAASPAPGDVPPPPPASQASPAPGDVPPPPPAADDDDVPPPPPASPAPA